MKKIIILTAILTVLSAFLNAQNEFPTSNAIWSESHINAPTRLYGLLGDSVTINEMVYFPLRELSDTILSASSVYLGLLRTDGQKVWFSQQAGEHEVLLYDFSAEVGDIVYHNGYMNGHFVDGYNCDGLGGCRSLVTQIDTVNNRKIYHVDYTGPSSFPMKWIEGIGTEYGLFLSTPNFSLSGNGPYDYNLDCFKHNDTVKYLSNPKCNKCFCSPNNPSNIDGIETDDINIFPNPASDILNIYLNNELINSIEIIDDEGKTIKKYVVNAEKFELNISDLKPSNYLIKIVTNRSTHIKKMVKKG